MSTSSMEASLYVVPFCISDEGGKHGEGDSFKHLLFFGDLIKDVSMPLHTCGFRLASFGAC